MNKKVLKIVLAIAICVTFIIIQLFVIMPGKNSSAATLDYFSPFDVAYSPDGTMIAVSDLTKAKLNIISVATGEVSTSVQLNGKPKGVEWCGNTSVYVAEYDAGSVAEIDIATGTVLNRIQTGIKPAGLAVSNGKLVVTDFGMKKVTVVDVNTKSVLGDIAVKEYPYFVDISTDGNYAIIGHATPVGNAMASGYASSVTFVDINTRAVTTNITLPTGSTNVRDIKSSPDGQWAYVVHTLGKINLPTTQITKGWVNTDALTIIDVAQQNIYTTVLLDTMMEGAADPWGLTISSDSNTLWVSISGTHQVYKLDLYNLHKLLLGNIPSTVSTTGWDPNIQYSFINKTSGMALDVPGGKNTNGTQMIQWPASGSANQKWNILDAGSGYYYIKSVATGKNLDNRNLTTENAPIVEYDVGTGTNQQWSITAVNGYFQIINRQSGKALDNAGSATQNTGIVQKTIDTSSNQQWRITIPGVNANPTVLYRSKVGLSKPYSDVWFKIRADLSKRTLLKNDLGALWSAGLLTKIKLPGQGPRGISLSPDGTKIAVGAYFSGAVYMIDTATNTVAQTIQLGMQPAEDSVRRGERTFYDASTTTQKWLSCATCHPEGRADGLNWDMPNDGIGNTKNTKSMYKVFEMSPAMWRGQREDAFAGVVGGFKFIKFKIPTQQEIDDVSAYIQSFEEETSPYRNADGTMTDNAIAGKLIFESAGTQCSSCHTGTNLTDLTIHNVGTKDDWDIDGNYVTPPIEEMWRTAPYLHDGSAQTMRDVLTTRNVGDTHGHTSQLTSTELDQLEAYLLQVTAGTTGADTQAPTVPTNLVSTGKTVTTVSLSWSAATDNLGVTEYQVCSGSSIIATLAGTTYTVTGLASNTSYTFNVKAKDAAENISDASNEITVTTDVLTSNLVLNKNAIANAYWRNETPTKAVDGIITNNSKWCTDQNPSNQWLQVDLDQNYTINRWVVRHAGEGGESTSFNTRDFKLQMSTDGTVWADVDVVTGNTENITDRSVAEFNSRYVRLFVTVPSQTSDNHSRIYEFEVYGY